MSSLFPTPAHAVELARVPSRAATALALAGHRADIEGLRGIAVLSVLAVHAYPQWLRGGFIGVDIFFVLSGYLITGILLRELDAGRFSLLGFYDRRIRRLLPALCLVLAACLAFALVYTFPSVTRQLGRHVAAGALFVSNLALWQEAGYFDAASEAKPLLHLWSLGIEEQFYLLWPLALAALARRRRGAPWLIGGALAASFALNVALVGERPTATFFLPPTRFWELMVGALLAWWSTAGCAPLALLQRHAREALAWGGLALLALALWAIDKTDPFPGWRALLPTLGTAALLAAGSAAWVNRRVLGQPLLRFYGAISYPLYLWHWPLLCFPTALGLALTHERRVAILISSVVLAALTYELVEKPMRQGPPRAGTRWLLCGTLALLGLTGATLQASDGLLARYPTQVRGVAAAEFSFDYADYRVGRCMLRLEQGPESFTTDCSEPPDGDRELLMLWGDSHAASLYPGLLALRQTETAPPRLAQYTAARCPPIAAALPDAHAQCTAIDAAVLARVAAERPSTVVLAGHWARYAGDATLLEAELTALRQRVDQLRTLGVARIVVFGHLPTWTLPQPHVLMLHWNRQHALPTHTAEHLDRAAFAADRAVANALQGSDAVYVSPIERLCDARGCVAALPQPDGTLAPLMHDESHLSTAGAALLMQRSRAALLP